MITIKFMIFENFQNLYKHEILFKKIYVQIHIKLNSKIALITNNNVS